MNSGDKFDYTYFAPTEDERREIESIRKQYVSAPDDGGKLEKLRALNKRVTRPPKFVAAALCIAGVLTAGLGMAMVMEWNMLAGGIIVGVAGIAAAAAAYPAYRAVLRRGKRVHGQRIIDLSNELLNSEDGKE